VNTASLGKYAEAATTAASLFLIVAAVLAHVFQGALPTGSDMQLLDMGAILALGAMFGKQSAANGYASMAKAAHARLDAIGAPAGPGPG
jgi:hypothetical protein